MASGRSILAMIMILYGAHSSFTVVTFPAANVKLLVSAIALAIFSVPAPNRSKSNTPTDKITNKSYSMLFIYNANYVEYKHCSLLACLIY